MGVEERKYMGAGAKTALVDTANSLRKYLAYITETNVSDWSHREGVFSFNPQLPSHYSKPENIKLALDTAQIPYTSDGATNLSIDSTQLATPDFPHRIRNAVIEKAVRIAGAQKEAFLRGRHSESELRREVGEEVETTLGIASPHKS